MLSVYNRGSSITLAITVGIACIGLSGTGLAKGQQMDCAVAKAIAARAYQRAEAALKQGKYELAFENKRGFWDIEEYSHHCRAIQTLAALFTANGFGRDDILEFDDYGNVIVIGTPRPSEDGKPATSGSPPPRDDKR